MIRALAVTVLVMTAGAVHALDGNELLKWHEANRPARDVNIILFIRGMAEVEHHYANLYAAHPPPKSTDVFQSIMQDVQQPAPFCMPEKANFGQAYDLVIKHLQDNAAQRHFAASIHVRIALRNAWPCSANAAK